MKAIELKQKYLGRKGIANFSVICISEGSEDMHWYHVHDDEEVPTEGYKTALLLDELE